MKFEVGKYVVEMLMVEPEGGMNPFTGEYGNRFEKIEILEPTEFDKGYMEECDYLVRLVRTDEILFLDLEQSVENGVVKLYREL
ncbi:hypothetical protein [Bacillus phage YungSlug]|nr:hypothetical protein [Bacillus phage YungSlug]